MNTFLMWPIVVLGFTTSVLWGLRSAELSLNRHPRFWNCFYEFAANFFGSLAAWCCVYALVARVCRPGGVQSLNGGDAVLFLVAVLGLTGHLTQVLVAFINATGLVAAAAAKKLAS